MPKSTEQCEEIKRKTREKILHKSVLYFARNGFAGTKISDLARYIGIGQGTIYLYFSSKDELLHEIQKYVASTADIKSIKALTLLPLSAEKKIIKLSTVVLNRLANDINFAAKIALNTQMLLESGQSGSSSDTTYQSELYHHMIKIINQGQREGSVVEEKPLKLADYYWGVVYLYALKRLFTKNFEMIDVQDLNRTLLKPQQN